MDILLFLVKYAFAVCCFVKYATFEEANVAIGRLHGQYTFFGVSLSFLAVQMKFLPSLVPKVALTLGLPVCLGGVSH